MKEEHKLFFFTVFLIKLNLILKFSKLLPINENEMNWLLSNFDHF